MNVRAIEHVGITVPEMEEATRFFVDAFGAEKLYDMLDEPLGGPEVEAGLGIAPGAVITVIRMLRLGNGPNLELFSYSGVQQAQPVVPSDFGIQHICIYVDDIDVAASRLETAGGILLSRPGVLPGGDAGNGNRYVYTRTPWGSTIELVTYPSTQSYERHTHLRRWRPRPTRPNDFETQAE
jgi:catechol 2,3-dioxygenase-like lactoylglutathione lyase family enzyme